MQNLYIKSLNISGRVPDLTAGRYINQPRRQRKKNFYVISRAEYEKNSVYY